MHASFAADEASPVRDPHVRKRQIFYNYRQKGSISFYFFTDLQLFLAILSARDIIIQVPIYILFFSVAFLCHSHIVGLIVVFKIV